MFKNITLAFLLAFGLNFSASAQFSFDDDSLFTDGYVDAFTDMSAHTYIRNPSATDSITVVWTRIVNILPTGGWSSAICDINTCYGTTISTEEFTLAPKGVGELSFHFYTGMDKGKGQMIVRFAKKSDPTFFIDVTVNCQAYGLGVSSLRNETFNIYPNPAQNMISIGNSSITEGTLEVTDILGKVVLKNTFSSPERIDVSTLPKGVYSMIIRNETASAVSKLVIE